MALETNFGPKNNFIVTRPATIQFTPKSTAYVLSTGNTFLKIYSTFSLKNFIEFTDDGEVEIGRDARLGAHLTLVDARIPRLDVFDLQDPVLGLRLMDHMPRQTRVTRQRGVRPVGH